MNEGNNIAGGGADLQRAFDELLLTARDYTTGLRDQVRFADDGQTVVLYARHAKTDKYFTALRFMRSGRPYGDGQSVYLTVEYGKVMYHIALWRDGKCAQYLKYTDAKRCLQVVFDKLAYSLAADYEAARHAAADGKLDEAAVLKRKLTILGKISKEFSGAAIRRDLTPETVSDSKESFEYMSATVRDYAEQMGYLVDGDRADLYPRLLKTAKPGNDGTYLYAAAPRRYCLEVRKAGVTVRQITSGDLNLVLCGLFYSVAKQIAIDYEAKHRVKYQDSRRSVNAKLVELMDRISPLFSAYATGRVDENTSEYPYDDAHFAELDIVDAIRQHAKDLPAVHMNGNLLATLDSKGNSQPFVYFCSRGASGSYVLSVSNQDDGLVHYDLARKDGDQLETVAECTDADAMIYAIFDQLATVRPELKDNTSYKSLMQDLDQNKAVESERLMSGADAAEQIDAEQLDDDAPAEPAKVEARALSFTEKKQFAKEVRQAQADLVSLAVEAIADNNAIADAYIYILTEGNRVSYNAFYINSDGKVVTLADAQPDKAVRVRLLKFGASDSKQLRAVYVRYGQPVPTETMIHFVRATGKFDFVCNFKPVVDEAAGRTAATSFAAWRRNIAVHY